MQPVTVGLLSVRGLWLAWRHRLRADDVYVLVAGRVVPARDGWEAVRAAIAESLTARASRPGDGGSWRRHSL